MAAKLTVKKEYLQSEIHFDGNGGSYKVVLASATQAELEILKKTGDYDHLFEKEDKKG